MFYAIVCRNPFIYLYNEKDDVLAADYEFVIEDPIDCGMPKGFVAEEYKALTPSEFSRIMDEEVKGDYVYTFADGTLVRRRYKKAPYFYVENGYGLEYPTYCSDPNTIKAGLLTNEKLAEVIASLVREYKQEGDIEVSLDIPLTVEDAYQPDTEVLAYVCLPVLMKKIPIGVETEEEKEELQADIEDTQVD